MVLNLIFNIVQTLSQIRIRVLSFLHLKLLSNYTFLLIITFLIPFIIGGPQLIVGSLVNFSLAYSSLILNKKNNYLISIVPSLAAISRGFLFGPFTIFLVYIMPFIWFANFTYCSMLNVLSKRNLNIFFNVFVSSLLKVLVLFIPVYILVSFSIIPKSFLTAMGGIQVVTAVIGGSLVGITTIKNIKE